MQGNIISDKVCGEKQFMDTSLCHETHSILFGASLPDFMVGLL